MTQASSDRLTLYRFWNSDGDLLYVGRTVNFAQRWSKHQGATSWWLEIAQITIEHFADADFLDAAEFKAIQTENPRHNIRGRNGANPDRKIRQAPARPVAMTIYGESGLGWSAGRP